MELLDVKFGPLAHAAPQNRTAILMNFQHVSLGFFSRIPKHALENHRHVSHQIDRIIVHHDLPRHIDFFFGLGFFFPYRRLHRRCRSFFELPGAHRAHEKNAITLSPRFKPSSRTQSCAEASPFSGHRLCLDRQSRANGAGRGRRTSAARLRRSFQIVARYAQRCRR